MPINNYGSQTQQPIMHPRQQPIAQTNVRMIPQAAATSAATASSSGGIGSFFSNLVSNPSAIVGNVEKIVQVAQSVSPVVQQYGPLMRNFPNLTKILSAFTPSSNKETAAEETTPAAPIAVQQETPKPAKPTAKKTEKQKSNLTVEDTQMPSEQLAPPTVTKTSAPKLYV